jgi:hypothetical protein
VLLPVKQRGPLMMTHRWSHFLGVLVLLTIVGCASSRPIPKPLLEPSGDIAGAGTSDASQDWRACHQAVWDAAPRSIQPHRLIPPVIAPDGVMIGTMDAPHATLTREDYKREMERCLMIRGYQVRGWH